VRKVNVSGKMRVIARGPSEDLAAFSGDLFHKQRDENWHSSELPATKEDESELIGGGKHIARSSAEVAGGSDSSGQEREQPLSVDTGSVDTGSSASSRIITEEVRKERQRMEALMEAAIEAAALEAEAFREAIARKEAAALESYITALMKHASMTRAEAEKVMRNEQ
jgi:hypothetical protein